MRLMVAIGWWVQLKNTREMRRAVVVAPLPPANGADITGEAHVALGVPLSSRRLSVERGIHNPLAGIALRGFSSGPARSSDQPRVESRQDFS